MNNSEELVETCEVCRDLGNTTQVTLGRMFYTISPDPERYNFGERLPEEQKTSIDRRFTLAIRNLNKYLTVHGASRHYELNKGLNLHIHGIIYIDIDKEFYDKWLAVASKIFAKEFGRQYVNSTVSCRFEWCKNIDNVLEYINKSNVYPPTHEIKKNNVQLKDWIVEATK